MQHSVLKNHSDKIIASGNSFSEGSLFEFFLFKSCAVAKSVRAWRGLTYLRGVGRGVNICTSTKKYQICKFLQICCSLPYFPSHQEQEMSSSSKIKKCARNFFLRQNEQTIEKVVLIFSGNKPWGQPHFTPVNTCSKSKKKLTE